MKKSSGVDINLGNKCSRIAYNWAKQTFKNRIGKPGDIKKGIEGAFSNVIEFNGSRIGISSDGIGTKVELAERTGIYHTLGFDLVAMVVDDLAANGFEAANLSNILDVDYLDDSIIDELMKGLSEAADFAGISVPGGEIAELGNRIGGWGENMHFNWCSTAIGILPEELNEPVSGKNIKAGDKIISLASRGFRSNGFSLLRKILNDKYGDNWHKITCCENQNWGELLLTPCLIYSPLINDLIKKKLKLKGIAHITGGGLADNLYRVLKVSKVGAKLDNIHKPKNFMTSVQALGNISEEQAYRIWNMGNGMLLIADPSSSSTIIEIASQLDYSAQLAGEIISEEQISISTKGVYPQIIKYDPENM